MWCVGYLNFKLQYTVERYIIFGICITRILQIQIYINIYIYQIKQCNMNNICHMDVN